MRWKVAAAGVLAVALMPSALAAGPESIAQSQPPQQPSREQPPATGAPARDAEVQSYVHPARQFVIPVPKGVQVTAPDKDRVILDSRQGYRIIIQTNDANPQIPLPRLNDKFEAQYLGQGKPFSVKLQEQPATVAGLQAVEAKYEGAGSQAKLIMVRGIKTDFVFMFFAPRERFEVLDREFQWVLENFRPDPRDRPAAAALPSVRATPAKPPMPVARTKRFADARYGYTIDYPGDWEADKPSATIATFTGPKGTDAYFARIIIQNVQPPAAATAAQATEWTLADQKALLDREARDVTPLMEQPLTYKSARFTLAGRQMLVTYSFGGERYRRWIIVVPRPKGNVTHVWIYSAPESKFETFRPVADAILKSWTIQPDGS